MRPMVAQARSFAPGPFSEQCIVDGLCANESQVALSQLTPQRQNPALQADFGLPALLAGSMRLVSPIHLIELLSPRPRQPILQVTQAHAKSPRRGSLRQPATNRRHHCLPIFFREVFMPTTVTD